MGGVNILAGAVALVDREPVLSAAIGPLFTRTARGAEDAYQGQGDQFAHAYKE